MEALDLYQCPDCGQVCHSPGGVVRDDKGKQRPVECVNVDCSGVKKGKPAQLWQMTAATKKGEKQGTADAYLAVEIPMAEAPFKDDAEALMALERPAVLQATAAKLGISVDDLAVAMRASLNDPVLSENAGMTGPAPEQPAEVAPKHG